MRVLKILHVEDREEDLMLFERACEAARLPAQLCRVRDGFEAITYLKGLGEFTDRGKNPLPDLIVLDLTMPVMTGWEFRAAQLSVGDPALAAVPVLLLTAMPNAEQAAEELQVLEVIKKPFDYDRLIQSVRRHCHSQHD